MGKVTLTKRHRDGETVKTEEMKYTIERWTFDQLIKLAREINSIMQDVKAMDGLSDTLDEIFGGKAKLKERALQMKQLEGEDNLEEFKKMLENKSDTQFMDVLANAFDYLAQNFPHKVADILSVASDIPVEDIRGAYAEEVLDLFDEIVKENDIVKLWNRVKKSFFSVKDHWASLVRKATR